MTAFLENTIVWPLFLGTVNFAKMMPAMQAWIITPKMLCRDITMMANGHCSVVDLEENEEVVITVYI